MRDSVSHTAVEGRQAGGWHAKRLRATVAMLAVGLVSSALALAGRTTDVFASLELDSVDARFSIRGTHGPPLPIVIVAIDERTLREVAEPWPIRRRWHAQTIDALHSDGARAVVYDVQFSEPSPRPLDDKELIDAAARTGGRIVLATTEVNEAGEGNVLGGQALLDRIGARAGYANVRPDSDGTLRRVSYATNGLESFGLVAAEIATGELIDPDDLGGERAWIDFLGPSKTVPHYSLSRVALDQFEPGTFRGKVVVVGASAAALQDIHRTSTDARMDGAEIQANIVSTALAGFPLQSAPGWFDVLLIVACGLLVPLLRLRLPLGLALLAALGAAGALAAGTQLAFQAGWVTSFVYPGLALLLSAIGVLILAVDSSQTARSRV